MIYQLEKQMKENEEKLTDADREPLNKAIEKLRTAAGTTDAAAIRNATTELEQAAQAFGKVLYEKTAASGGDGASAAKPAGNPEDDAIDAEFEVKQ